MIVLSVCSFWKVAQIPWNENWKLKLALKKIIAVNLDNEKENEDEYLNKFGLLYTIY